MLPCVPVLCAAAVPEDEGHAVDVPTPWERIASEKPFIRASLEPPVLYTEVCALFAEVWELPEEALRGAIAGMPPDFQDFMNSIAAMDRPDRARFYAVEYTFRGHCGEQAYLTYLDDQCAAAFDLTLPENRSYRVEVLDTWNMERNTVLRGASGQVRIGLPGKPWMAVLATEEC